MLCENWVGVFVFVDTHQMGSRTDVQPQDLCRHYGNMAMRKYDTWITFSFTLALTLACPLSESMAGENWKQETKTVSTQVKPGPVLDAPNLLGVTFTEEETAPGELSDLLSAEADPAHKELVANCQPWIKPTLCTQDSSEGKPANMANHKTENIPAVRESTTDGTTLSKTQLLSCVGSPGTNHFFLPIDANQPVFPAASQIMNSHRPFAARSCFQPSPKGHLADRQPGNGRGTYREIPQTLSPKTIPKVIHGQEIRISPRPVPIILRAVPQRGSFRQASSTARIKMNLPSHQKRAGQTDDTPATRPDSTPTETTLSFPGFREKHTNQNGTRPTFRPKGSDTNR